MKKQGKAIILGVSALAISSVAGLAGAHDVSATEKNTKISTAYEQLFEGVNPGEASKVETVGDYTFYYDGKHVMVSSNSEKEYEETGINKDSAFTNGKTLYYTKGTKVYKLNLKTKKIKKIATVKKTKNNLKSDPDFIGINTIIKNRIYLTRYSWGSYRNDLFSLNTKTNKLKKETKGEFAAINGRYAVIKKKFTTDVSTCRYDLVKLTNKGLKKIEKLCDDGMFHGILNDKFYFSNYIDDDFKACGLFRSDKVGKNIEFLGSIRDEKNRSVIVSSVGENECTVNVNGKERTFDYDTKDFK